jgi:hypothetical protein
MGGVRELAAVYHGERRVVEGLRAECHVISVRGERHAGDGERGRFVEGSCLEGDRLEVRAAVACGDEAQTLDLGGDVVRGLHVADGAGLAALHRVVREDVESSLQVASGDRRFGRGRRVLQG